MYLQGKSVLGIAYELERLGIKSPTWKEKWAKWTIDIMLSNEKYSGNVRLLDDGNHDSYYFSEENNPAIISKEIFKAVQIEKQHRSNVTKSKMVIIEKVKNKTINNATKGIVYEIISEVNKWKRCRNWLKL